MPKMVMPFRALVAAGASWDEALAKAAALTAPPAAPPPAAGAPA
jgi:hypothetical protein